MSTTIDMPIKTQEKRQESRSSMAERLIIQVHDDRLKQTLTGDTMSCLTRNRSRQGLQIQTPIALPAGTSIDLWLKVGQQTRTFLLTGRVCWSLPEGESGQYYNGVEVESGDLDAWAEFVESSS